MKNDAISKFLSSRIAAGDFPSASYLVAEKGEVMFQDALGRAVVKPEEIAATTDTIYDLASVTKVVVTGLLAGLLVERAELRFEESVHHYLPEFSTPDKRRVTVREIITHTSGFAAWKPFYLLVDRPGDVAAAVVAAELAGKIGEKVVYSDLNFVTLGRVIEKVAGWPIDGLFGEFVAKPLGLENTCYNPLSELKPRIAASENGNEFEKNTCVEQGYELRDPRSQFRNGIIWGEVHDGNCYFMNGVSGHAGLFSTAFETFRIAQQFLAAESELLKPSTCELFRTNFTPGLNEARSLAFQLAATPESTASLALAPDSFGHLGFTGTSLWIEPSTERVFILLTNRTHNRELPFENINSVRRRFHELATTAMSVD